MATCIATQPIYGYDYTPKYNAGAFESGNPLNGDCFIEFKFGQGISGGVVGLSYRDNSAHYNDIEFGIQLATVSGQLQYRPIESGIVRDFYRDASPDWAFTVLRVDDLVIYTRRNPDDPAVLYYDYRVPGIPLPGVYLFHSPLSSYGTLYMDSSLYGAGDSFCLLESASDSFYNGDLKAEFTDEGALPNVPGTIVGELPLGINAAGTSESEAAITSRIQGQLGLEMNAVLTHIPVEASLDGQIGLDGVATGSATADPANDQFVVGELPLIALITGSATADPEIEAGLTGFLGLTADIVGTEIGNPNDPIGGALQGVSDGKLYMDGYGVGIVGGTADAVGRGYLTFSGSAQGSIAEAQNQNASATGLLPLEGYASATAFRPRGVANGELGIIGVIAGSVTADPAVENVAQWDVPIEFVGVGSAQYDNYFQILLPELSGTLLTATTEISDEIRATSELQAKYVLMVREFVQFMDQWTKDGSTQAVELLEIATVLAETLPEYVLWVQDTINVADNIDVLQVVKLADTLRALGMVQTTYQGTVAVMSALVASDNTVAAFAKTLSDSLTVGDTLAEIVQLLALMTDTINASDTAQVVLTILVEELAEFTADDTIELTAQYFANLFDRTEVLAFIKTPAELAQGWVVNTEGAMPVSEYDNYQFNSLAYSPEEMLGCSDTGLYVLDGDTDDGDDINAEIASLMMDFDTSKLKRMSTAYLGYTSSGQLLLKVRSVDQGEFVEHWYEGRNANAQVPAGQNRMKLGKGMRSRYWTFELVNIDGSDFELDKVELYPIVLQRRI